MLDCGRMDAVPFEMTFYEVMKCLVCILGGDFLRTLSLLRANVDGRATVTRSVAPTFAAYDT